MTTEEIAKAQEWCAEQWERDNPNSFIGYGTLAAYAAHVTAEKDKEIERLRAEITRLRAAQSGFMEVGPLDEDDYEEIVTAAAFKMKKFASGARGQAITVRDSFGWWVMKETERRIRALAEAPVTADKDKEIERLRGHLSNLVEAVDDLISESEGVYGLRLNGDPSLWEELTEVGWLRALEEARAALDGEKE